MEAFLSKAWEWLAWAAMRPENPADWAATAAAWTVGALFAMKIAGWALDNPNQDLAVNFFLALFSGAAALGGAAAVSLWVPPAAAGVSLPWLPAAGALAACLILVIPLFRRLQRASYLTVLLTVLVAFTAAALLQLAARTALDGVRAGRERLDRDEQRRREINRLLD